MTIPPSYTQTHVHTHITARLISRILLRKCASADCADDSTLATSRWNDRILWIWRDLLARTTLSWVTLARRSISSVTSFSDVLCWGARTLSRPLQLGPLNRAASSESFIYLTEEVYIMYECEPAGLQWSAAHLTVWTQILDMCACGGVILLRTWN